MEMKGGGILIVEDEDSTDEGMASILRKAGFHIIGPFSAIDEAVAQSRQTSPDLVLVDITARFSYEWLKIASTIWEELAIPIAYASSYPETIARTLVTLPHPIFCLRKPYSERELCRLIETVLKKGRSTKR
jgi:DNA-binding response OmpR family regulator